MIVNVFNRKKIPFNHLMIANAVIYFICRFKKNPNRILDVVIVFLKEIRWNL